MCYLIYKINAVNNSIGIFHAQCRCINSNFPFFCGGGGGGGGIQILSL